MKAELSAEMCRLTGVENPNSVYQLLKWLEEQGYSSASLGKEEVAELLKTAKEPVRSVLALRQQLAKSSVKKYTAMTNMVCSDDRARGTFSFYGASRTGRFSGRNIQLQNLPQNHIPDLAGTREIIRNGDFELSELLYDNIPDILSQLIRTALIPKEGYKFIVADFSSIEARVLAWLAGETWRMQAFARGDDIYCASASKMFGVPVVKHGINGHLRQKGKVAELACIAEGQLVLTNHGLIPIEKITTSDKVWDGESWVEHDGVIYKGEREVITYEGLTATPDHLVWVEGKSRPVQFGIAAASGSHLVQTGNGGKAVWLGEDYQSGETLEQVMESLLCADKMFGMQFCPVDTADKSYFRKIEGLSALFQAETDSVMAGQKADSSKTAVRKSERCRISQLWCKGYPFQILKCHRGWAVPYPDLRTAGKSNGDRPDRQQRRLCFRQPAFCNTLRKLFQPQSYSIVKVRAEILAVLSECCCPQTFLWNDKGRDNSGCRKSSCRKAEVLAADIRKARLYDIRNAGRHHRFTVSGKLVHNCGYGGSIGAMKAMGGSAMGLSDKELKQIVTDWRTASPNIVKLWYEVDDAAMTAVIQRTTTETHGIKFIYQNGILFVELPSKRRLAYIRPQIDVNRFGGDSLTYEGVGTTKKWERIETYGARLVENIVQGIARDLLCHSMKTLSNCQIVAHVHDELIIEADENMSVEAVCERMAEIPDWAEGLILRADGFECAFYQKD
ncbi:MAG: DNA polymerase [Oscillospiraceae bacterium]